MKPMLQLQRERRARLDALPGVTANPMVMSGAPCIAGTRINVAFVHARFLGGESVKAIAKDYRLTEGQIEAAIRYEALRHRLNIPAKVVRAAPPEKEE